MNRDKQTWQRREEQWRRAHRSRPDLVLPPEWQASLMRKINRLSRQTAQEVRREDYAAAFSRLLFRFAGAGAVVAMGLLLYAQLFSPDLEMHAANMVVEQPAAPVPMEKLIW